MTPMKNKKPYSRAYVEITNICNRSCSFCPGTRRDGRMMTLSEFSTVADKLTPLTDYVYLHVMGEPLLHPELSEIISAVTSRGMRCAITTNGTLLPDRQEELLSSGVYKVNISVHSFEGGDDSAYHDYMSGIVTFADKASRRGILTVLRLWNEGSDGGLNDRTVLLLREHFTEEWTYGPRGARLRDKLHLEYGYRFEWPDTEAPLGNDSVFCYGLGDHFGILSDGTVIPCCLDREGVINLGNAYTDDLCEILSGERATAMREGFRCRHATEELCKRCGYARRF